MMKFALAAVVHPPASDTDKDVRLLTIANAWLSRAIEGHADRLLLMGAGFVGEGELQSFIKSHGLSHESISVVFLDGDSGLDVEPEVIAWEVERWVHSFNRSAVPSPLALDLFEENAYPRNGWWWTGVEAGSDEYEEFAALLKEVLPTTYSPQSATWAELLALGLGFDGFENNDFHNHERLMAVLAFARWMNGFDTATENSFYDFPLADLARLGDINTARLAIDAMQSDDDEVVEVCDDPDADDDSLLQRCLLVCLRERNSTAHRALQTVLGGEVGLFVSVYSLCYPKYDRSLDEFMGDLVELRYSDYGEIHRAWEMASDGWTEIDES